MNNELLKIRRDAATAEARSIVTTAESAQRGMTEDEKRAFAQVTDLVTNIDNQLTRAAEQANSERALNAIGAGGSADLHEDGAEGLRAFLHGEVRSFNVDLHQRDLLTSGTGTNTVPHTMSSSLVEHLERTAVLRSAATVMQTESGEPMDIPKTLTESSATITAEAAAIPESDPTFGKTTLGAHKYGILMQVSNEMMTNSIVQLASYLGAEAGRALGRASGAHYVNGTGTDQPSGIVPAAASGVTLAGTTPTAEELIDLYYSVIPEYRGMGTWVMSDEIAASIRKLQSSDGHFIWTEGLNATPPSLLGRPVLVDPNVPTGTGNKVCLFGDLSRYFIRDAGGVRFERSDDFAFANDLVTFRALLRTDGALVDETGAVKAAQAA